MVRGEPANREWSTSQLGHRVTDGVIEDKVRRTSGGVKRWAGTLPRDTAEFGREQYAGDGERREAEVTVGREA